MSSTDLLHLIMLRVVLTGLVVVLGLAAIGFLIATLLLFLLDLVPAPAATLLTAMTVALGAFVVRLVARRVRKQQPINAGPGDLMPAFKRLVERHSWSALATSIALGAVAELTTKRPAARRNV